MIQVTVKFHTDLYFFLHESRRSQSEVTFYVTRSVKDLIESLGVPHVEVGEILVNGAPVGFDYLLKTGDIVHVFPPNVGLSPGPKQQIRFIADVHLKSLTRSLRMLGFDTLYDPLWHDVELARISENSSRVLLSRDTQLLMRSNVSRGLYIRSTDPGKQVIEVMKRFQLIETIDPFMRCISCNGAISDVKKEELNDDAVPPGVIKRTDRFYRCETCGKYFWDGSHVERMRKKIEDIRSAVNRGVSSKESGP